MKEIKLKYLKRGRCDYCHEKEEDLYQVQNNKGELKKICEICISGVFDIIKEKELSNKDLILEI